MSMFAIFDIAGSGMTAQTVRIKATASNLSNAETVAGSPDKVYKARYPIFSAVQQSTYNSLSKAEVGVKVDGIHEVTTAPNKQHQPGHALADKDGYVYLPNVNVVDEMTNMLSAQRSYQMNLQLLNSTKQLMMRTLQLGQ